MKAVVEHTEVCISMKRAIKSFLQRLFYSIYTAPSSCVLMLHSVGAPEDSGTGVNLSKNRFDILLDSFQNFDHLETILSNPKVQKIALTFDDGYKDIFDVIYTCLKERDIPFTVFITYDLLDTPNYLTKEQLVQLSNDPLVTIGSHCKHHIPLAKASKETQQEELLSSHQLLESLIQKRIAYLAYPYGQYNNDTLEILNNSQTYSHAFVACGSFLTVHSLSHPYKLPRMNISNKYFDDNLRLLRIRFR